MDTPKPSLTQRFSLGELLLNLLFPPRCVACNAHGHWLCPTCLDQVLFYEPPWPSFMDDMWPLQDARAAALFRSPLREAIHQFKYEGLRALASILGEMLYDSWEAQPWPVELIVPVPLHPIRLRERGYNQSALLARELARHIRLPVAERALLRIHPTPPQVGLNAEQRAENVRNAFRCGDDSLRGKRVLLIDDVLTTGSTLRACAQALLEGGAQAVWALTLAKD